MMRAIVLATQKGGSGKSTLAIGLAVAAMGDGHRVAIIETDQQGTVSNWGRRRTLPEPRIERAASSLEIERSLLALRHNGPGCHRHARNGQRLERKRNRRCRHMSDPGTAQSG